MNSNLQKAIENKKKSTNGKLRLSYTLMSLWEQSKIDLAVSNYFHLETEVSQAMIDGRKIHKKIENHIKETQSLPEYMPQINLSNPKPEEKLVVEYNQNYQITTIIDCLDEPNILEFKTGKTKSSTWASSLQVPLAFLVTNLANIETNKAYIMHYNQHTDEKDFYIIWKNKRILNEVTNYVDTMGAEIYKFFKEKNYL